MFGPWKGEELVGALEVLEIPETYMLQSDSGSQHRSYGKSFISILRGMILAKTPVALRLERTHGKTRVLLLTWARNQEDLQRFLDSLSSNLVAHLPKFKLKRHELFQGFSSHPNIQGINACLVGEPEITEEKDDSPKPMDVVGECIQNLSNAILQVFVTPTKTNRGKVRGLERAYERAMEQSQQVVSAASMFSPDIQQSTTRVSASASRDAERLSRQIKRMSSRYLGKVSVVATCWHQDKRVAETEARRLLSVLMSSVTPADKEEDLRVEIKKKAKDFEKALAGRPIGKETILVPEEIVNYFTLPRVDMGIKVSRREDFSTAGIDLTKLENNENVPQPSISPAPMSDWKPRTATRWSPAEDDTIWRFPLEKLLLLGYAIRNNAPQKQEPYGLVPRILGSHVGIYGNTGYGKTTTAVTLIAQAYRNNVIPIILTPGNVDDWRVLRDLYDEFRIFTAGNPDVAPLRYNMWNVPDGVPIGKYIDRMVDVHTAALPTDGVISMHFDDVFNTMYENCGWSRMGNVRGRPILLSDLYEAVHEVADTHLKYGDEMRRDFHGALDARLRSILRNDILVDMFNTPSGLTIPELLSHPTIIETRDLSPEDRALLTGALTVGISEYLIANPRKTVSHLLVIEEAHHFLKRPRMAGGYAEPTSQQKATENITEMLRTQRGTGLGLMLIDQLPSSLPLDIVKLPSSVIIHTLTDVEERTLVGRQALCNDAQIEHIGGMGIGEIVARVQTQTVPSNVQVVPLDYVLTQPLPKRPWTDAMIRSAMRPVFEGNPHLDESHPLSGELRGALKGISAPARMELRPEAQLVSLSSRQETDISEIVNTPAFVDAYLDRVGLASQGDPAAVARLLTVVAGKFCSDGVQVVPFAERLLLHAAGMLQEPRETAVLGGILLAIRGTSV
ncbi:MAG: DUF87 domain-containing protein [Candidatus Thorarchaeota archaeon]|nr:DUF87 domain-containing protein [Candidatus Thorarchaeota archaeon]